jgi:hypothetical protein
LEGWFIYSEKRGCQAHVAPPLYLDEIKRFFRFGDAIRRWSAIDLNAEWQQIDPLFERKSAAHDNEGERMLQPKYRNGGRMEFANRCRSPQIAAVRP